MAETITMTNGKPRKQLSDQLDRLDEILDLLAEGLPQAVADAAREGTRLAVRDAILEIVSNPELRTLITPPIPTPAAKPNFWVRLKSRVRAATTATVGAIASVASVVAGRCRARITTITTTARALAAVVPVRRVAMVGLGVGTAVYALCSVSPHTVAAAVAGVGSAITATAAQIGILAQRSFRTLGFAI